VNLIHNAQLPNEEDRQCNKNIMHRQQLIGRMEDI
jgi:hypothetical protein